jgi:iron complex transport system substrate-binding protein
MEIEQRYNELKTLASTCKERPRLLTERPLSGTWHVPNGESTTGILYRDAGADYLFADILGSGASAMSIEMVLDRAMHADLWLIKSFGTLTKEQVIDDTPACKHIPARMLVCNTEDVPFFEETPFHPEYLLENLISVLHPELGLKAEHEYFR